MGAACETLLRYRLVAAIHGVPSSWVYSHVREGAWPRLPHRRMGRTLRFVQCEVEEFARSGGYRPFEKGVGTKGVETIHQAHDSD